MSISSIQLLISLCSENNENSVWDKMWVLDFVLKWTFWVIVLHLSCFRVIALCSVPWKAKVLPLEVLFLSFWKKAFLEMMPEWCCVPCAHHLQEHYKLLPRLGYTDPLYGHSVFSWQAPTMWVEIFSFSGLFQDGWSEGIQLKMTQLILRTG